MYLCVHEPYSSLLFNVLRLVFEDVVGVSKSGKKGKGWVSWLCFAESHLHVNTCSSWGLVSVPAPTSHTRPHSIENSVRSLLFTGSQPCFLTSYSCFLVKLVGFHMLCRDFSSSFVVPVSGLTLVEALIL